ncbi:endonuclease IV [Metarhizium robertsii]|uniref:Apurinic-apyrimidinic endonuclease 1 n=2 Tax=Metarhizium robertsii TaxID=568076 RepID=E9ELP9_METRA|nr:apurinic/apyrimidinic endonuclease-like protein [Metarhizium robertsii ARSEF 23]EFZ03158.2 apurinic/apyrimidinic endonuclease-like protein [Metarhizium robertsii ARSEF 23]EXV01176.1 endonuclease IV [Metarhizium robertsii]
MPRASPRKRQVVSYNEDSDGAAPKTIKKSKSAVTKVATKITGKRKLDSVTEREGSTQSKKQQKRPKTNAKAEESAMKLADRTTVSSLTKAMYIGAHVSAAGGVQNAVSNAVQIGANSFALFLKSQRKWDNPPIPTEARDLFTSNCKEHNYSTAEHALPHGSYLVNLAQADESKAAQAYKSFVDDLERCEQLGIKLYNFHPGSTGGEARPAAIGRIAAQLNRSHKATQSVITVLENMAGAGNVIGSTWEDLRDIIALVDQKDRVGVCIDTCHAFAAGYDLRTPDAFKKTMEAFDKTVGYRYLKAFHLNDSKAPLNSNRDLHANIGTGFLGLRAFHGVMNCDNFCNMPMILETPIDKKGPDGKTVEDKQVWADEIKLLESLIGMDPESDEFKEKEKELQAKGAAERNRIQDQVDKRSVKNAKKGSRAKRIV